MIETLKKYIIYNIYIECIVKRMLLINCAKKVLHDKGGFLNIPSN